MKETYGQLWDQYVDENFRRLQREPGRDLAYPGAEWGSEESWRGVYEKMFVPAGAERWAAAIEIGGGAGKYAEQVLIGNPEARVWGFDVSRSFLKATAERLREHVDAKRLSLRELDPDHPDFILRTMRAEGLERQVDAVFSIDAMVHVDLQYLVVYWINAALVLKPGGRVVMSLADPSSPAGMDKLTRDIKKFYKFQGRICPKFEFLSAEIVTYVLGQLGFTIEFLDRWASIEGKEPRDLYLIARLDRPEEAERYRAAISTDLPAPDLAQLEQRFAPAADAPATVEDAASEDERDLARVLGQAYWRQLYIQANPTLSKEELKAQTRDKWGASRREFTRLGHLVLRQLDGLGYKLQKADKSGGGS